MYVLPSVLLTVNGAIFLAVHVVVYFTLALFFAPKDQVPQVTRRIIMFYIFSVIVSVIASIVAMALAGFVGFVYAVIYVPAYLGPLVLGLIPFTIVGRMRSSASTSSKPQLPQPSNYGIDLRALYVTIAVGVTVIALVGIAIMSLPRATMPDLGSIYRDARSAPSSSEHNQWRPLTMEERSFLSLVGQDVTMTALEMTNPLASWRENTPWLKFVEDTRYCASKRLLFVYPSCIYQTPEHGLLLIIAPPEYLKSDI